MSITFHEESNLDKLLAGLLSGGFQVRTFEASDAMVAVREIDETLNTLDVWTALQDGVEHGFMVVNRRDEYRLTPNGIDQARETLHKLGGEDIEGMYAGD
jgi:hypothetical protein